MTVKTVSRFAPVCHQCHGSGLTSWMDPLGYEIVETCDECGGYGYLKYRISPVRHDDEPGIIAWTVLIPNRDFVKIEFSFEHAVIWMDIHAAANYGAMEAA